MTVILFCATLMLNIAGFVFAGAFLWINVSGRYSGDLSDRNNSILKIAKISMITSNVFSFLTCFLSNSEDIASAISKTSILYFIIAITWLVVILACGVTMLLTLISKTLYSRDISRATKRLFKIALIGAIVGLVLSWLFA